MILYLDNAAVREAVVLSLHGYGEVDAAGPTWLVHVPIAGFGVPAAATILLVSALGSSPSYRTDGDGEFRNLDSVILKGFRFRS